MKSRSGAYDESMLTQTGGVFSMEVDIDDLIFGDRDPGPSER